MSGLTGKPTAGVGTDIVSYLTELAAYFDITIHITSAYRDPDGQGKAMYDNWEKLDHGHVYKTSTLPAEDRKKLDSYWKSSRDASKTSAERTKAKSDFLELAKTRVGSKSAHCWGRAVDVSRGGIHHKAYQAITLFLHDVKEGSRTDIYHFESREVVPPVNEETRAKWKAIKGDVPHLPKPVGHAVWC